MTPTRREFIKSAGIAIASLVMVRCASSGNKRRTTPFISCYSPLTIPGTPVGTDPLTQQKVLTSVIESSDLDPNTVAQAQVAIERDDLRACWLQLDQFAQYSRADQAQCAQTRDELIAMHQTALYNLVAASELDAVVADQAQIAFQAAVHYLSYWKCFNYVTCYTATPIGYTPEPVEAAERALAGYISVSVRQLIQQADLLSEMAQNDKLDLDTITLVKAVIERDIAFLRLANEQTQSGIERVITLSHLSQEETWALYDSLGQAVGDPYDLPVFDDLDLEITPEAIQATQFLVELLLEE